ncbi:MAG: FAD:protein FMN transferase [Gammaproteobacteria bacterium]
MAIQLLNRLRAAEPQSTGVQLEAREPGIWAATFFAMGSPCEILFATPDSQLAKRAGEMGAREAWRIERKYSRYRKDSVVSAINRSRGQPMHVDAETAALLDYAAECYRVSDGMFDITSGVLRRVWKFDGSDRVPSAAEVQALLPQVGFHKLDWQSPAITLPDRMEIDFGGIGKEYAVDRVLQLITTRLDCAVLVNFGGDLCTHRAPASGPWRVGIERPDTDREARLMLDLSCGALATSGDTRRYLLRGGVRYGHILDPRTGWPVSGGPRSVSVAAGCCVHAGMLASVAMLQGSGAEHFLQAESAQFWLLPAASP